jgi:ribonuclease J
MEYIPDGVPQYMSEGTKELLSIKYEVLYEGANKNATDTLIKECDQQEHSDALSRRTYAEHRIKLLENVIVWQKPHPTCLLPVLSLATSR